MTTAVPEHIAEEYDRRITVESQTFDTHPANVIVGRVDGVVIISIEDDGYCRENSIKVQHHVMLPKRHTEAMVHIEAMRRAIAAGHTLRSLVHDRSRTYLAIPDDLAL